VAACTARSTPAPMTGLPGNWGRCPTPLRCGRGAYRSLSVERKAVERPASLWPLDHGAAGLGSPSTCDTQRRQSSHPLMRRPRCPGLDPFRPRMLSLIATKCVVLAVFPPRQVEMMLPRYGYGCVNIRSPRLPRPLSDASSERLIMTIVAVLGSATAAGHPTAVT